MSEEWMRWEIERFELMLELFIMVNVALVGFCLGMVYGTLG